MTPTLHKRGRRVMKLRRRWRWILASLALTYLYRWWRRRQAATSRRLGLQTSQPKEGGEATSSSSACNMEETAKSTARHGQQKAPLPPSPPSAAPASGVVAFGDSAKGGDKGSGSDSEDDVPLDLLAKRHTQSESRAAAAAAAASSSRGGGGAIREVADGAGKGKKERGKKVKRKGKGKGKVRGKGRGKRKGKGVGRGKKGKGAVEEEEEDEFPSLDEFATSLSKPQASKPSRQKTQPVTRKPNHAARGKGSEEGGAHEEVLPVSATDMLRLVQEEKTREQEREQELREHFGRLFGSEAMDAVILPQDLPGAPCSPCHSDEPAALVTPRAEGCRAESEGLASNQSYVLDTLLSRISSSPLRDEQLGQAEGEDASQQRLSPFEKRLQEIIQRKEKERQASGGVGQFSWHEINANKQFGDTGSNGPAAGVTVASLSQHSDSSDDLDVIKG